jgi:hypothetical protein
VNRLYTTNGLNQYTQAGTATFAYDPNGNLTSDGSTGHIDRSGSARVAVDEAGGFAAPLLLAVRPFADDGHRLVLGARR